MLVNQFNGGESSNVAPQMLAINEGAVYVNIDESKGTLSSMKDKLETSIITSQFAAFYEYGNRFIGFPIFTSFVEYGNDLIYCNEGGSGKVRGDNEYSLGLEAPVTYGTATPGYAPNVLKSARFNATATATTTALLSIPILYALVNVSGDSRSLALKIKVLTDGSVETVSTGTNEVDNDQQTVGTNTTFRTITISNPSGELGSSGVEVYRFYNGYWRLIGTLTSAAATLTDSTWVVPGSAKKLTNADFANLQGTYQYLLTYYNTETGAESDISPITPEYKFASGGSVTFTNLPVTTKADKKRLYRVGGALSNFALVAQLDMAVTSYTDNLADTDIDGRILSSRGYLPAPARLSYIEESGGMLFGAVGTTVRFTPIGKPDAWPAEYEIPFGTAITGLAEVANGVLVFTRTRTYIITGTGPTTLAKQLVDPTQGCVAASSIQKLAGNAIWVSTVGICVSSGGRPEVISRAKLGKITIKPVSSAYYDDVYYCLDESGVTYAISFAYGSIIKRLKLNIASLVQGNDKLYGWLNGILYELFASNELLEFEYLSPRFIEGRSSELKAYKKFYFFGKGDIIVNIIVDDAVIVADKLLNSGDTTTIQSPQEEQRGNYIQFAIKGKGELFELEYEAGGRRE